MRAASYAALDRLDEAKSAVADALAARPKMTIQGVLSEADCTETERQLVLDLMRKAGFPPYAAPEHLAGIEQPLELPECTAEPG